MKIQVLAWIFCRMFVGCVVVEMGYKKARRKYKHSFEELLKLEKSYNIICITGIYKHCQGNFNLNCNFDTHFAHDET